MRPGWDTDLALLIPEWQREACENAACGFRGPLPFACPRCAALYFCSKRCRAAWWRTAHATVCGALPEALAVFSLRHRMRILLKGPHAEDRMLPLIRCADRVEKGPGGEATGTYESEDVLRILLRASDRYGEFRRLHLSHEMFAQVLAAVDRPPAGRLVISTDCPLAPIPPYATTPEQKAIAEARKVELFVALSMAGPIMCAIPRSEKCI